MDRARTLWLPVLALLLLALPGAGALAYLVMGPAPEPLIDSESLYHWLPTAVAAGLLLLAEFLLILILLRVARRPLRQVVQSAQVAAYGPLDQAIESGGSDEQALVARALNHLRERLAGQQETTARQRETVASIINQLGEGVVAADAEGRVILINPAALRLLELSSRSPESLLNIPVERAIQHLALQRMLVSGSEAGAGRERDEVRLQFDRPQGDSTLLARAADIHLPVGGRSQARFSSGRLLVLTDVTELARTIQMKTDFVANASHELRTPISTIRAAVETLQSLDLAESRAPAQRFLAVIDRQSRRLEALASDLLDLHRLELRSEEFPAREVVVAEFWRELGQHFDNRLRAKSLGLVTHSIGLETLRANPQLLQLLVDNLVDNAIKFTDQGGLVECTLERVAGGVRLAVRDTGCGIPAADLDRVFERFYQVERARSGTERGTGLGLSIVRHAVQAMRGGIHISSTVGQGTRVEVTIPQID